MGKGCSKEASISITDTDNAMDKILTDADYKTRLEQKLCMFKETPEPICDLSECNLEKLPGNSLFSIVKVQRKEILILGKNRLKSLASGGPLTELELLQVLDLSHNKFKVLPVEICVLKNLRVSHHLVAIKIASTPDVLFIGIISVQQPVNAIADYNQSTQETGAFRCLQQ